MEDKFELVPIDVRYQIEQYRNKVKEAVTYVRSLNIQNKEQAEQALDIACEAINLAERIEETKKSITEPSKRFKSEVDRLAKDFTTQLEMVKDGVVEQVDRWKLRSPEVRNLETSNATTVDLPDFTFEVSDMTMVPKEYMVVDEARIKLAMKQGVEFIPGLHLKKQTKTSIRRK